ncbi:hypothetical protein NBRC111894_4250 [Sporolactobacillus inulinus]|uniref:Uncharacterized protein n=1 Tax=Sporolactobacillus inulinus TaxID=2078 RepID=A0A4Y1ZHK5_9BACL|nr:hypothetical protein NBRC111894_4250 [Sporolactobacillus inulinus]
MVQKLFLMLLINYRYDYQKIAISNNNRLKNMDIIIKNYEKCLTIFIDKIKDLEIK